MLYTVLDTRGQKDRNVKAVIPVLGVLAFSFWR